MTRRMLSVLAVTTMMASLGCEGSMSIESSQDMKEGDEFVGMDVPHPTFEGRDDGARDIGSAEDMGSGGGGDMGSSEDEEIEGLVEPEPEPPEHILTSYSCDPTLPPTPRRMWRLKSDQFQSALNVMFHGRREQGEDDLANEVNNALPFATEIDSDRFSTRAASYAMSDLDVDELFTFAFSSGEKLYKRWERTQGSCVNEKWESDPRSIEASACFDTLFLDAARTLYNRPLTQEEEAYWVQTRARASQEFSDPRQAAINILAAVVASTPASWRAELGEPVEGSPGIYRLTSYEIASALSYSLTNMAPDKLLWEAAEDGSLEEKEVIAQHVRRLLAEPRKVGTLKRFVREYFRYDEAAPLFKDISKPYGWTNNSYNVNIYSGAPLVGQTDQLVADIVETSTTSGLFEALMLDSSGYATLKTRYQYDLNEEDFPEGVGDKERVRMEFDPQVRFGVLTQPSWLSAFGHMHETNPVARGRFLSESLLCRPVPELTIEELPPLPAEGTARDKLAIHSQGSCGGCHRLMDPLGLAFENYDYVGRYRTEEAEWFAQTPGLVIDPSGRLASPVDGETLSFSGPRELVEELTRSEEVKRCFIAHSFTYWMGRVPRAQDGCALDDAFDVFDVSGGDYVEALVSMFTSDTFLYRSAEIEEVN